jgi:LysR family transcriptional regulator, regulator for metE and metH
MKLEVRHLRLIRAIAEEGSVTRAGNRLFLTQSALSHQLRDIETKLGVTLFDRVNKRMLLTSAGKRILIAANEILDHLDRLEEDVKRIASNQEGVLRISTECYTCYHWLPQVLKRFNVEYPGIDVKIIVEATGDPISAVLDGVIDVGLTNSARQNHKIRYQPLFRDEYVVIVSREHPFCSKPWISANDFHDQHLVIYSAPEENRVFQKLLVPARVKPRRVSSVQLTEAIVEMVKAGLGIGILSKWSIAQQLESGMVQAIPLTKGGFSRTWYAATLKTKKPPAHFEAFIRLLANNSVLVSKTKRREKPSKLRLIHAINPDATLT